MKGADVCTDLNLAAHIKITYMQGAKNIQSMLRPVTGSCFCSGMHVWFMRDSKKQMSPTLAPFECPQ